MSDYIINAIVTGVWETFQMTFFASLFSYAVGMPLGILLYATSRGRLLENRPVNFIIGLVVNITRSLPFLILLVLLIPFTRMIVGKSIGTEAAIVPLTIGAIPIVARMVESSLNEVQPGIIEAATSMGASPLYTIIHFIIAMGIFYVIAFTLGWFSPADPACWIMSAILVFVYFLIWMIQSLIFKHKVKRMNEGLRKWKSRREV